MADALPIAVPTVDSSQLEDLGVIGTSGPPTVIPFGDEGVTCMGAEDFLLTTAKSTSRGDAILIAVRHGPIGIYSPMDATLARQLAANLIRAADFLDGGKGKQ